MTEEVPINNADEVTKRGIRPKVIAFIIAGVIVLGGAGVVTAVLIQQQQHAALIASFEQASSNAQRAIDDLATATKSANDLIESITDPSALEDPTLLDELTALLGADGATSETPASVPAIDLDVADDAAIRASAASIAAKAKSDRESANAITALVKQITESIEAKAYIEAAADLQTTIESAEGVYTSSEGRVADEQIRTDLRSSLDASIALLSGTKTSVADIQAAKSNLTEKAAAVLAARQAVWNDVNGTWCGGGWPCETISLLKDGSGGVYVHTQGNFETGGCLGGTYQPVPGNDDGGANVVYCPAGSAFTWMTNPAQGCGIREDVSRDRLYVFQGCTEPRYRD